MNPAKELLKALADYLTARWLWIPILVGVTVWISFVMGIAVHPLAMVVPYAPSLYYIAREVRRRDRMLPRSEAWETGDLAERVAEYVESLKREQ